MPPSPGTSASSCAGWTGSPFTSNRCLSLPRARRNHPPETNRGHLMPLATLGLIAALVVILLYNTIKVLKEYERGVVFFLGRFQKVKGPGLILLFPVIQT